MISVGGHNYSSMAISGAFVKQDMDVSIQRLSTGRRINSAKDDVGGVQISSRLNAEIKGLEQASKNAADAQSLIDTASVAIKEAKKLRRPSQRSVHKPIITAKIDKPI